MERLCLGAPRFWRLWVGLKDMCRARCLVLGHLLSLLLAVKEACQPFDRQWRCTLSSSRPVVQRRRKCALCELSKLLLVAHCSQPVGFVLFVFCHPACSLSFQSCQNWASNALEHAVRCAEQQEDSVMHTAGGCGQLASPAGQYTRHVAKRATFRLSACALHQTTTCGSQTGVSPADKLVWSVRMHGKCSFGWRVEGIGYVGLARIWPERALLRLALLCCR